MSGELDSKITRHISEEEYQNGWRLACVSTIRGDVEVEVPDIASAYRSRMKVADLSSPSEIAIFEDTKRKNYRRRPGIEKQHAGDYNLNGRAYSG